MVMSGDILQDTKFMKKQLAIDTNFDIIYRVIQIGGRQAVLYFIDGFCKDELMELKEKIDTLINQARHRQA